MAPKGLIMGSEKSCIAICTLWTELERFSSIPNDKYRLMGNLYSFTGISKLIRTIYEYPQIRTVIVCGLDLGKAGEAFIAFMRDGIDDDHKIVGSTVYIEREIPKEFLDIFRNEIELIDMRTVTKPEPIQKRMEDVLYREPFQKPMQFPEPQPVNPAQFPADDAGLMIHEETIALAWPKILSSVMRFGTQKKSHYQDVKELMNLVAVIDCEDPDKPALPAYMGLSKQDLEEYYPQIVSDVSFEGTSYTYGQRLRHVPKKAQTEMDGIIDQIDTIVAELKDAQFSRRALALTWRVEEDIKNKNPPCLILVQCSINNGKLHLTAYFRSNDVFGAWPKNAYGLRKLQQHIAQKLEIPIGSLTTISASAHIYEPDWLKAIEIAEKHVYLRWRQDKRGYFVIKVEEGKITLKHYDNNGPLLQTFEGTKAEEIYKKLVLKETMSYPEHLAYIGMELAKAEIALKLNLNYVQEEDLKFS